MAKKSFPLSKVYTLMEPGPVVLLTTTGERWPNIMTMSWHTMLEFEPPLLACVISERDYTFGLLKKSGECVINIPTVELAKQVVGCGNTTGRKVEKFRKFRLTPRKSCCVKAPMIDECYASLECKVIDLRLVGVYNLFILEVVQAWVDPKVKNPKTLHHRGKGLFMVGGKTLKLKSKMK